MDESMEVKAARIEERVNHLCRKVDQSHKDIHRRLDEHVDFLNENVFKTLKRHDREIERLKRDRWWIFTICGAGFSLLATYIHLGK